MRKSVIGSLFGLAVSCATSFGQVITVTSPCGVTCGTISNLSRVQNANLEWEISFTAAVNNRTTGADDFQVWVQVHAPGQTIRHVRVTANRGSDSHDYVVVSVFPNSATDSIPTLYELSKSGGSADLIFGARNFGQLGTASTPAVVSANSISNIYVEKNAAHTGYTGNAYATITATSGNFLESNVDQFTADGDFIGSVSVGHRIGTFDVLGNIGSSSSTATLSATNQIRRISADRIWGNISTTAGGSFIQRIETTVGNFVGSISSNYLSENTGTITPGFYIAGDLDANLSFTNSVSYPVQVTGAYPSGRTFSMGANADSGNMTFGSLAGTVTMSGNQLKPITVNGPMTGKILIGGSLTQPITVGTTGNPGLTGQIIANAANGSGTWTTAAVKPAGSSSSALSLIPYYTNFTSVGAGGGAVGLAPFHLYEVDCSPAHNSSTDPILDSQFNQRITARPANVRFYGPVFTNFDSPDVPVVLERHMGGTTWHDMTQYAVVTMAQAENSDSREISVVGQSMSNMFMPGTFRIVPADPIGGEPSVSCDRVSGTPAAAAFDYRFTIAADCNNNARDDALDLAEVDGEGNHPYDLTDPRDFVIDTCVRDGGCWADIDGNGFLNGLDHDWFVYYFEDGFAPIADYDLDGFITGIDYDVFLLDYDAGC